MAQYRSKTMPPPNRLSNASRNHTASQTNHPNSGTWPNNTPVQPSTRSYASVLASTPSSYTEADTNSANPIINSSSLQASALSPRLRTRPVPVQPFLIQHFIPAFTSEARALAIYDHMIRSLIGVDLEPTLLRELRRPICGPGLAMRRRDRKWIVRWMNGCFVGDDGEAGQERGWMGGEYWVDPRRRELAAREGRKDCSI
jgi:hypothetical protein